ncbi:soluble lytic murein transglycosylase-like protein [Halobacteroides halobius DSM 5150]|uniref:Soluble lytic murein transglycosylase-like protein n=1 Tax=Halobacteroides halobius (strain ATCC 35273 / DSM 5150 / MD-1) TaxID=748449 RepID=L0KAG1_HALHC|nr:transglycosylase SLT domain-containing protein [Halobacteroides halobius]AGB41339.1 soluble lytic murein transglycosylase-like protein [Halobacteroides halobius DSM 5150]
MKIRFILVCLVLIIVSFSLNSLAYDHKAVRSYISYRIKYIHSVAYNTNIDLSKERVQEYTESIIYWSDYYSRELNVNIDPLLVTAIIETETNFVSRADYDNGDSIGVASMKINTAKWIAKQLGVDYNKWSILNATDLGIRFAVYYLGLAFDKYRGNLYQAILSYNQGLSGVSPDVDQLYDNYLFKVLGRYKYYQKRLAMRNSTAATAVKYFNYKFNQFY